MKVASAWTLAAMFAAQLPLLTSCSLIVEVDECEDNSQCILEDGTELVCGLENTCIDVPALGETCLSPRECLEPLLCVSSSQATGDDDVADGFCAMDCSLSSCEEAEGVPEDWVCCELSDGSAACLPAGECGP
ncbi:MAG: hypothetical protein KUG77_06535 [Nannocystaceae bacterium]|nr:hypothetical protein [Nannocystaceae bacterium]